MIGGAIVVRGDDGTPPALRMPLAPASAFTIERTWSARGLTATASHDVVLGRWCFPEEWTLPFPPPVHADVPFAHVAVGAWPARARAPPSNSAWPRRPRWS